MVTEAPSRHSGARGAPRNSRKIPPEHVAATASNKGSNSSGSSDTLSNSSQTSDSRSSKQDGRKRSSRSCCPSARNKWLLQPLLLRAQQVFAAVESELQKTLQQQQQHIAATAVRDLQAFADLLSSLVCSQGSPHELLHAGPSEGLLKQQQQQLSATAAEVAPAPGRDASSPSAAAAAPALTPTSPTATGAAVVWYSSTPATPGAQLRRSQRGSSQQHELQPLLQLHEEEEEEQQQQQQPKLQQHMDLSGTERAEKRRRALSKQAQAAEGDPPVAGVALTAATPAAAAAHQSKRRRESPGDDGAAPTPVVAGATAVEPPAAASAAAAACVQRPAAATIHPTPPPTQAPGAVAAVAPPPPPPPPPPPFAAVRPPPPPPPLPSWAATGPTAAAAAAAVNSRQLSGGAVAVSGLSSEALEALNALSEKEREETIEILNALSLPLLQAPTQEQAEDPSGAVRGSGTPTVPGAPKCSGSLSPADYPDSGLAEKAVLSSRQQKQQQETLQRQSSAFKCSSNATTPLAPRIPLGFEGTGATPGALSHVSKLESRRTAEGSDAEEGEISDYGPDRPNTLEPPAALENATGEQAGEGLTTMQQQQQQQIRIPRLSRVGEGSLHREGGSCSSTVDLGECWGPSAAEAPLSSQGAGPPDSSLLDALIAARPLSSEAVLCNLYSLKKCEAARPQPQPQRKPKRRTQEAQERHRQRWAEIQQRRAQAAAKRQQLKGSPFGKEGDGGNCNSAQPSQLPFTPLTPC
ncbi:hypothetical protein, conserved [Eimeria acervulina]|uniref:Uncharacterized protein n=1 Tax=Eimeria acervulina TaxID=5801 RepID=U6GUU7_EIMAC|nr:hypothetical protein, conserved [Eimeria acervulina]CDI84006.1 hypothetical protein, conserved [Eimeria acervulina]